MTYKRPDGSELVHDHRDIRRILREDAERSGHTVRHVVPHQHMDDDWYWHVELVPPSPPVPVDRSKRELTSGGDPNDPLHRELKADGQQRAYVVLSPEERARGFVRPVRTAYRHLACRAVTTMGQALAETYARDPGFYNATFCAQCGGHYPVGADGEFEWLDGGGRVGT